MLKGGVMVNGNQADLQAGYIWSTSDRDVEISARKEAAMEGSL